MQVYETVLSGVLAGQFVQTVFHFKREEVSPSEQPYTIAEGINSAYGSGSWITAWCACCPEDYKITSMRTRRVAPTGGPTAIELPSQMTDSVGTRTGEISSAQVSPLIVWIGESDQAITGKTFVPGVSEDDIEAMQLVEPLVDALTDFVAQHALVNTVLGADCIGAIYNRVTKVGRDIDTGYVSPLIGTQRRRLRPV